MMYPNKKLDQNSLTKIQELEQRLNCCIVALDQPPRPAPISTSQLEEIKALEKELGATLVAYKCR